METEKICGHCDGYGFVDIEGTAVYCMNCSGKGSMVVTSTVEEKSK